MRKGRTSSNASPCLSASAHHVNDGISQRFLASLDRDLKFVQRYLRVNHDVQQPVQRGYRAPDNACRMEAQYYGHNLLRIAATCALYQQNRVR